MGLLDEIRVRVASARGFGEACERAAALLRTVYERVEVRGCEEPGAAAAPSSSPSTVPIRQGARGLGAIEVAARDGAPLGAADRHLVEDVAAALARAWLRDRRATATRPGTALVCAADGADPLARPVNTPIYGAATYEFADAAEWEAYLEDPDRGYIYTRWGNPTTRAVEARLARLEGAEAAHLYASGTAAIAAAAFTFATPGKRILHATGLYGGTHHLFHDVLARFGVEVAPGDEPDARTAFLYAETISNPTLRVADLETLAARARAAGVPFLVDNTFATPLHARPVERGATVSLESATKSLGGHADLMAGVVAGAAATVERIDRFTARHLGVTPSAHDSYLLGRGLKTLALRVRRQSATALEVARRLESDRRVPRVLYPGLASHPDHAVAARTLDGGFGSMVTFDLGTLDRAKAFIDALEVVRRAASLGGVESLVSIPVLSSHYKMAPEDLEREGIGAGMVRLSVGIEDPADIVEDLDRAIALAAGR